MLDFSEKLYTLLASPYAFIQIRSYEERRVVQIISALANSLGRPVTEWSPGGGGEAELLKALDGASSAPEGTITILKDAHPYLSSPRVVRRMRDIEAGLSEGRRACILISPFVELPRELLKDVTFLDAPLPGRIELSVVFEQVYQEADGIPEQLAERVIAASLGLTLREAERAFKRAKFERSLAQRKADKSFDLEAAVVREKRRLIEADQILQFCELDVRIDQVGGLVSLKRWLGERREAFSVSAAEFGLPAPKGLLLTGVQGCGKSLFAKSVASYWGVPLLRLDIGRLFDGVVPPEAAMQRAIDTAEALAPSVLWLDEIDKAFGTQDGSVSRIMASLLSWLQDKTAPVFFVATANRVQHLPAELLRKGRFDEVFFVDLPGPAERADILRIHCERRGRDGASFDLVDLAGRTEYFSGAELEQVVVSG
ncbi:MAG: AAA family ATPase, partial [Myxococcales bacterium]|nr:AAA family ATPase [Myxococcales bacterium]